MKLASLSAAQQGIWLGQAIKPTSPMYNTAEYIEFKGEFDAKVFELAATQVLQNTTALNMAFILDDDKPAQSILSPDKIKNNCLVIKDFSNHQSGYEQAVAFFKADLKQILNIKLGQNYRHTLIKVADNHYLWNLSIHHIACDGYSFVLLADAVLANYQAQITKEDHIKTPFSDYKEVRLEDEQYRHSKYFEKDLNYWRTAFNQVQQVRSINTKPVDISETQLKVSSQISKEYFDLLEGIANSYQVTWTDLLITLVASIIHQYTGVKQTVLGMPVSSRMGSKSANVPCMKMNIVPVIIDFSEAKTFENLLVQISKQIQQSRRHFRSRYEDLKNELSRNSASDKLFGAVVNIIPFERNMALENCIVKNHILSAGPVEDLAFTFVKQLDGSLKFDLYANSNAYSQELICQVKSDLISAINNIEGILTKPLFVDYNRLSVFSAPSLPTNSFAHNSVLTRIYRQAKLSPAATALRIQDTKISYCELIDKISTVAANIWNLGLDKNQTIALVIPRSEQAITMMMATLLLGHRFVFLDPQAPTERNLSILSDASPNLIIVHPAISAEFKGLLNAYFVIETPALEIMKKGTDISHFWLNEDAQLHIDAYLIYTSGSTGKPKGVVIDYAALNDFTLAGELDYQFDHSDIVLQFAPFHFDACIEEVFITLSVGGQLVLRNDEMLNSASEFFEQCKNWQITILDLPTAYWHELALATESLSLEIPKSIETIIIGGEAVQETKVALWRKRFGTQVKLLNTYGPSEATVVATYTDLAQNVSPKFIGKPLLGRQVVIVDEQLNILPKGEVGELLLLGAGLSKGYLNLPEQTRNSFIEISITNNLKQHKAYRTGDLACIHDCNNIEFVGRIDSQIKISGYRIEPGEIEQTIISLESIDDAVITISNTAQTPYITAHLVSNNLSWNEVTLRQALAHKLPSPMLPSVVMVHDSFAKNSAGKVDRKVLSKIAEQKLNVFNNTCELTETESLVANIWREVLGISELSADDDFFLIGGQSLQSIQVANRLCTVFNREIPVSLIFSNPTLSALANALAGQAQQKLALKANTFNQMDKDIAEFSETLLPNNNLNMGVISSVLLTGATGFIGAQLLKQLLDTQVNEIICPVRADDETLGLQRLEKAFNVQKLSGFDKNRIKVLCLDLSHPLLGLSESEFVALANSIHCIFHNAAQTSVMRDYHSLRASNVLPTAHLLRLASIKGIPFNQVSTIAVADNEALDEKFIGSHNGLKDGYQQSKWVSEALVEIAQNNGYPVNVYRLGRVTGDLSNGYINSKDLVWSIIRAGLNNQVLPKIDVQEPWTPVDLISEFIIAHGINLPGEGVFNLTPQHQVKIAEIFAWLKTLSFDFQLVDLSTWCEHIKAKGSDQDLTILSFFEQNTANNSIDNEVHIASYINDKFLSTSSDLQLRLPKIDKEIFFRYLEYAIENKLISLPKLDLSSILPEFLKQISPSKNVTKTSLINEDS
jgi:nonribosomal peptide synthetase MxcG